MLNGKQIHSIVDALIDKLFVTFGGCVIKKVIGIPMGKKL